MRTQVFLSEEQCNRIDRAAEEGMTMSEVIRRAVDEYVTAEVDAVSERTMPGKHRLHYSVVTRAELFSGNTATHLATNSFPRSVSIQWIEQPPNERGE